MDLAHARQILVFGGTFDPPTVAHVDQPMHVMRTIAAEALVYVPAAVSPFKISRNTTPAPHRLAMLRLAVGASEGVAVLTDELDRATGEPSYTIDTLLGLKSRLPKSTTLRLLIGSDQLRQFDRWRDHERIVAIAEPVVMLRPPDDRQQLLAELPGGFDRETWATRLVDVPPMDVSSTDVRKRVRTGRPIHDLVYPQVARYIRDHQLYQSTTDTRIDAS